MTINVGDLVIGLRADVARLQSDMTAAKSSVQGAMKDIEQYVGFAKSAFVSLGGVLTIGAFKDAIAGAIEYKARLLDLSTQTGIGVTALGALGKTGKLTGTSLDDVATASAKLSKAIETQNEDTSGAARAIAALGLNFNQFRQLKPEDQLLAVARAMAGFADGTGKTAAAMELFGKNGATLLPFLRDLSERTDLASKQTEEASKRAKEYEDNLKKLAAAGSEWRGMLVDKMTPALAEFTRQMVEAKTWSERFAAIWANVKSNFGFDALGNAETRAKAASAEVERVTNLMVGLSNVLEREPGNEIARRRYDNLAGVLRKLQAEASAATDELKGLANADRDNYSNEGRGKPKPKITGLGAPTAGPATEDLYAKLIKTVNERIAQQEMEADKGRQLTEIERLQAKAFADIDSGAIKATLAQKLYLDGLLQTALAEEKLAKEREESNRENQKTLDDNDRRLQALREESRAMDDELEQFGMTREELQAVASARDRYTATQLRGRAAALDSIGAEGQLRDLYLAQADALEQLAAQKDQLAAKEARERNDPNAGAARAVREYLDTVKRAGDATYGAVQNSLRSLEDTTVSILGSSNAKQAARQWVSGLISEIQRIAIVRPLLNSIFNGGGSAGFFAAAGSVLGGIGSLFGGGLTVDTGGVGTNLTGNVVPTAGGRASGGPVSAGQSYLVGERGPEILRMGNQAGSVTPNGSTPNIQIINQTGTAIGEAKAKHLPDGTLQLVIQAAKAAVAADLHSGGDVSQAVAATFQLNRAASVPRY